MQMQSEDISIQVWAVPDQDAPTYLSGYDEDGTKVVLFGHDVNERLRSMHVLPRARMEINGMAVEKLEIRIK